MKLTEYRLRASKFPETIQCPDTELYILERVPIIEQLKVHKIVAVLFGKTHIYFTYQKGICPPALEGEEGHYMVLGSLEWQLEGEKQAVTPLSEKVPSNFFSGLPLDTPIIVRKVDDRYEYVLLTNDE